MRKIFVFSYLLLLVPFLAIVILIKSNAAQSPSENRQGFQLSYADGKTIPFTKENFNNKLILYFFERGCELCHSEVEEIMTYANNQKIQVLFVTTDDLNNVKAFERGIMHEGKDVNFSIARIKKEDVASVFKEVQAPQAILFGPGLEVRGVREEIISYEFLESSFE